MIDTLEAEMFSAFTRALNQTLRPTKIDVQYEPSVRWFVVTKLDKECTGQGRATCKANGRHSWFNHAMDAYHETPHQVLSNLPEGFNDED